MSAANRQESLLARLRWWLRDCDYCRELARALARALEESDEVRKALTAYHDRMMEQEARAILVEAERDRYKDALERIAEIRAAGTLIGAAKLAQEALRG